MDVTFTIQQFKRLMRITEQSWRTLVSFLEKEQGQGEFKPDLMELKEVGLVKKVGPMAYVNFQVNGTKPFELSPQVAGKKREATDIQTVMHVWRRSFYRICGQDFIFSGRDMRTLKMLSQQYAPDELERMVEHYFTTYPAPYSTAGLWKFRSALIHIFAEEREKEVKKSDDYHKYIKEED